MIIEPFGALNGWKVLKTGRKDATNTADWLWCQRLR